MRGYCLSKCLQERFEALPAVHQLGGRDETRMGVDPWLP
jgi:hypothetical protein